LYYLSKKKKRKRTVKPAKIMLDMFINIP